MIVAKMDEQPRVRWDFSSQINKNKHYFTNLKALGESYGASKLTKTLKTKKLD